MPREKSVSPTPNQNGLRECSLFFLHNFSLPLSQVTPQHSYYFRSKGKKCTQEKSKRDNNYLKKTSTTTHTPTGFFFFNQLVNIVVMKLEVIMVAIEGLIGVALV